MTFDHIQFAEPLPVRDTYPDPVHTRQQIDRKLTELLSMSSAVPVNLIAAIRHTVLAPGKRFRALLVHMISEPAPHQRETILSLGGAVEMVHAASLILDDLPCMDDAQTRRQRPATHVAFGQATAILSAIALLTRAFEVIASLEELSPAIRCRLSHILSKAIGWDGLAAGQEQDVNGQNAIFDATQIETLNALKTGVLFVAAAEMGAVARGLDEARVQAVRRYASHLGQAFQIADDIMDFLATAEEAGKDVGQDRDKKTMVTVYGLTHAQRLCAEHQSLASRALAESGVTPGPLEQMVSSFLEARKSTRQ